MTPPFIQLVVIWAKETSVGVAGCAFTPDESQTISATSIERPAPINLGQTCVENAPNHFEALIFCNTTEDFAVKNRSSQEVAVLIAVCASKSLFLKKQRLVSRAQGIVRPQ